MIKLKEGQKVLDENGNIYLIEKNDFLQENSDKENIQNIDAILNDYHLKVQAIGGYQSEWFIPGGDLKLDKYLNPSRARLRPQYYYEAAIILNDYNMDWHQIENAIIQYVKAR